MDKFIQDSMDKHDLLNRRHELSHSDINNNGEYPYETKIYFVFILCMFVITYIIKKMDT